MKIAPVSILTAGMLATSPASAKDRLTPVFSSDLILNGVATTPTDRTFLPVQPRAGKGDPQVVERRDGRPLAYPDAAWNAWKPGANGVNALRIGPDGALWIVDRGAPGIGKPPVAGGVKLVRIDIATDTVNGRFQTPGFEQASRWW